MKKIKLIIISLIFIAQLPSVYSQDIPKKMLKGIDVSIDEFSDTKTYSIKGCCLSIEDNGSNATLFITLACASLDAPISLTKIYILTNGEKTIIDKNENEFSHKEQPLRLVKTLPSGNFGTSNYKSAVFETRIQYVDTWKAKAVPYMNVIESIIKNLGKVKYEGLNNNLFLEFDLKDSAKMAMILQLYNYLTVSGKA